MQPAIKQSITDVLSTVIFIDAVSSKPFCESSMKSELRISNSNLRSDLIMLSLISAVPSVFLPSFYLYLDKN